MPEFGSGPEEDPKAEQSAEKPPPSHAECEEHARAVEQKGARESQIVLPHNWPHDANGVPMAIVMGQASELRPTVQFGNVNIGPAAIYRPVTNHDDLDKLAMEIRITQMLAQYAVATERRIFSWAIDPSTKIEKPSELTDGTGISFTEFLKQRLPELSDQ